MHLLYTAANSVDFFLKKLRVPAFLSFFRFQSKKVFPLDEFIPYLFNCIQTECLMMSAWFRFPSPTE